MLSWRWEPCENGCKISISEDLYQALLLRCILSHVLHLGKYYSLVWGSALDSQLRFLERVWPCDLGNHPLHLFIWCISVMEYSMLWGIYVRKFVSLPGRHLVLFICISLLVHCCPVIFAWRLCIYWWRYSLIFKRRATFHKILLCSMRSLRRKWKVRISSCDSPHAERKG